MYKGFGAVLSVGAALLAIAGCGGSSGSGNATASADHHSRSGMKGGGGAMPAFAHAELTVRSSHYGTTISDVDHRVLYLFAADRSSNSTCYGACAKAWPPLLTKDSPKVGSRLNSGLLGTTKRRDGSMQVTYAGHPLYYFSGDKGTKIMCQHVKLHGGFWYVVKPSGAANMAKGSGMMMQ
jgi:predicted lipoprotein with Yx(FWY)xxD motif